MDLDQKIAQRRAQLQQEQAAADACRKEEVHQQAQQKEAGGKEHEGLAAEEGTTRVGSMEVQLLGSKSAAPVSPVAGQRVGKKVDEQAAAKGDAHLRKRAQRRFSPIQIWICLLFFIEGVWGWFLVGWPALSLCILGTLYTAKVAKRHQQPTRSELSQERND